MCISASGARLRKEEYYLSIFSIIFSRIVGSFLWEEGLK